jgi:hypothetical protein
MKEVEEARPVRIDRKVLVFMTASGIDIEIGSPSHCRLSEREGDVRLDVQRIGLKGRR